MSAKAQYRTKANGEIVMSYDVFCSLKIEAIMKLLGWYS